MSQGAKGLSRAAVLAEVLRARPVSRKEIAERAGISAATVTRVTDALIRDGIVIETGDVVVESRGRRARSLDLVVDRASALGIDLGASNTRIVLTDLAGSPKAAVEVATPSRMPARELARWLAGEARASVGPALWPQVERVSLGIPGAVAQAGRRVSNAPNLPQVEDREFLAVLEDGMGRPLSVDNDANYALLGEQRFGAARESENAAMVTLGAGLGVALVSDGQVLRGRRGLIGEFGQLPIGVGGSRLEHLLTGRGILRRAQEAGIELMDPAELFVEGQSARVDGLRGEFDRALLLLLAAIVVANEPDVIVLGGGIASSLGSRLDDYRRELEQTLRYTPRLAFAGLGSFSGAVGAAVSSLRGMYRDLGADESVLAELPPLADIDLGDAAD